MIPGVPASQQLMASGRSVTPSYSNTGGTGDRTSIITTTTTFTMGGSSAPITALVNGNKSAGSPGSCYLLGAQTSGSITFQFGTAYLITEAKWYSSAISIGTFKWQGSNDGASWTDLSTTFTLEDTTGGSGTVVGDLSANASNYLYYRMLMTGGSTSAAPWLEEIEFKIGVA